MIEVLFLFILVALGLIGMSLNKNIMGSLFMFIFVVNAFFLICLTTFNIYGHTPMKIMALLTLFLGSMLINLSFVNVKKYFNKHKNSKKSELYKKL